MAARADGSFLVQVTARPVDGTANDAVVAQLASHFGVRRNAITLKRGVTSRDKVFLLEGLD